MKIFSPELRQRVLSLIQRAIPTSLQTVSSYSSWNWPGRIYESFTGAWQKNVVLDAQPDLLRNGALYACVTGIASDIAKNRIKLDKKTSDGIWKEIDDPHGNSDESVVISVLRKPNRYQNRIEFIEQWIVSKLLSGNAYILKERNREKEIIALYVLDPMRVTPKVAPDGSVWYELKIDYLSGIDEEFLSQAAEKYRAPAIPASEIIHDRMVCLWHPLVGVSPIYACAIAATMGGKIQSNSTNLFANQSRPGGILTAPGMITEAKAAEIKARFETGFSGANIGRIAVLGDELKFEPLTVLAEQNQLIEQLEWTVEEIGRAFHYPLWKLGGPAPPYSSGPQALTLMYYTDCLQPLIEKLEICLDEGFALVPEMGTDLDTDNLLRMDTIGLYEANNKGVSGGWLAPNEARFRANFSKVTGGESPMIQQQNYSLAALAKRDAQADPFATAKPPAPTPPTAANPPQLTPKPEETRSFDADDLEVFEGELVF